MSHYRHYSYGKTRSSDRYAPGTYSRPIRTESSFRPTSSHHHRGESLGDNRRERRDHTPENKFGIETRPYCAAASPRLSSLRGDNAFRSDSYTHRGHEGSLRAVSPSRFTGYDSGRYGSDECEHVKSPASARELDVDQDTMLAAFFAIDTNHDENITVAELRDYLRKNNIESPYLQDWLDRASKKNTVVMTLDEFCEEFGLVSSTARERRSRWHTLHSKLSSPIYHSSGCPGRRATSSGGGIPGGGSSLRRSTGLDYGAAATDNLPRRRLGGDTNTSYRRFTTSNYNAVGDDEAEILSQDMAAAMQTEVIDYARDAMRRHADGREMALAIKLALDERYGRLWHVAIVKGQYWIHYSHEPGYEIHFKIRDYLFLIWRTPA